jgi:hypothetical protein
MKTKIVYLCSKILQKLILGSMKQITLFLAIGLALGLGACGDDDGGGGPSTAPTATLEASRSSSFGGPADWSMSNPTAEYSLFEGLTINGVNTSTGEIFVMNVPELEVGQYLSEQLGTSGGTTTYVPQTNGAVYSTLSDTVSVHFVTLTAVDSVGMTVSGTFQIVLWDASGERNLYFFDSGVFNNVPYTDETFNIGGDSELTATIDGAAFTASFSFSFEFFGTLTISGSNDSNSISLQFPTNLAVGTYQMGIASANPTHTGTVGADDGLIANTGTLVITSNNTTTKVVTGTFAFAASNPGGTVTSSVTNGAFSIEY